MHTVLAALYGTGIPKVASDNQAEEEADLTQISAADFLKAVEEQEVKENGQGTVDIDKLDLTQMSAQELLDLSEKVDETEAETQEKVALEKMAESGELAYWDRVGRIMAHAHYDETTKIAQANDELPDQVDISDFTAAELVEILDSGEYELVELSDEEKEKVASVGGRVSAFLQRAKGAAGTAASSAASKGRGVAAAVGGEARSAKSSGTNLVRMLKQHGRKAIGTPGFKTQAKQFGSSAAKLGLPVAAVGGGTAAALAKYKSSRKKK